MNKIITKEQIDEIINLINQRRILKVKEILKNLEEIKDGDESRTKD